VRVKATKHDLATGRDPGRVRVFDTTLRDGEQSPGATLTAEEKMVIARQLAKLGVDVIEAGFPIASEGDFQAVRAIAAVVGNREDPPIICGLARALRKDIDRCWEAIRPAAFPRIHCFAASSDVHMEHKLRKTREEVLEMTRVMVSYARSLCEDVEFSAEDASRSDPEFLHTLFNVAVQAGATTLNVPDTVGYATPQEFGALVRGIRENVAGIESGDVILSVHGHDDLGMAVANFMSAVENGARQVECTINGIGERAGNAALEELVMAMHVRKQYYCNVMGRDATKELTNINTTDIFQTSRMVSKLTGMMVQPNKAIVGANAFAHESGIHQDGVLKNRLTYEIMDAKSIGLAENSIVLGKHSGRHALRSRLSEMGFELNEDELNRAFIRFKELADKKKEITSWDIQSLISEEVRTAGFDTIQLETLQVQCGQGIIPSAIIVLRSTTNNGSVTVAESAMGTGPVDAVYKAMNLGLSKFTDRSFKLIEYQVNSVTRGIDAMGEVSVRMLETGDSRELVGLSADTDIVVASAKAYLNAINRALSTEQGKRPIHPQKS